MGKTTEAFRLIVQRWPKLQGELFDKEPYCYHVIAANREEKAREVIALHNQRGEVENIFKELKQGFGMDWMPCGETQANAVFFRIGVIAYNLFQAMKLLSLPVWWQTATIAFSFSSGLFLTLITYSNAKLSENRFITYQYNFFLRQALTVGVFSKE